MSGRELVVAFACCSALAFGLGGPALLGHGTLWGADLVLDADPLLGGAPPPAALAFSDPTPATVDVPRDLAIARALRDFSLPLWNPLSAGGAPLWAEQAGPFFPLKLVLALLPTPAGYDLFRCLRLIAAGLGAYLLARRRRLRHWPAIGAGAGFELSGAVVETIPFGPFSSVCILPWVVLGAAAIAGRRDGRAAAGAALAIAVAATGGHPTLVLVVCIGFAAAIAGHAASARRTPAVALATIGWGVAALGLGLALAAPALLPLVELRAYANSYKDKTAGEGLWLQALRLSRAAVVPALLAPHVLQALRVPLMVAHGLAPALGASGTVLAIAGLRGIDAALVAVGAAGVTLALAPPGLGWVYALPRARVVLPVYAWMLIALPLTQAIGSALQEAGSIAGRRRIGVALGIAVLALTALPLASSVPWLPAAQVAASAFASLTGSARLVLPYALVAALLIAAARTAPRPRSLWGGALGVLLVGELLLLWWPYRSGPRSAVLSQPAPPAFAFLRQRLAGGDGRMLAAPDRVGAPLTPMLFGVPDLRGISALPVERYEEYLKLVDPTVGGFVVQTTTLARSPLLDLAAARYIVFPRGDGKPRPFLQDDPRVPLAYADASVRIYENRAALPRVRIAHRTVAAADAAAARAQLRASTQRLFHAEQRVDPVVVLEPAADGSAPPIIGGDESPGEHAALVESGSDHLRIDARLERAGVVVVADTWYPGWRAWVDGIETPIHPADALFRAVAVPAGTHTIELRYEPRSFRFGLWIAAAALLVVVVMLFRPRSSPP